MSDLGRFLCGHNEGISRAHDILAKITDPDNTVEDYSLLRNKISRLQRELHATERELQIIELRGKRAEKISREKTEIIEQIEKTRAEIDELCEEKTILATAMSRLDDLEQNIRDCTQHEAEIEHKTSHGRELADKKAALRNAFPGMCALSGEQRAGLDGVQQLYHELRSDIEQYESLLLREERIHERAIHAVAIILLLTMLPLIAYMAGFLSPASAALRHLLSMILPASGIAGSAGLLGFLHIRAKKINKVTRLPDRKTGCAISRTNLNNLV
jgi:hypothetical protein